MSDDDDLEASRGDTPLSPRADAQFYENIGRCIKAWAEVEEVLFQLCRLALGAGEKQVAIVFYRTPTLDARLKLVDELLRVILPQKSRKNGGHSLPMVKDWARLLESIRALLPVRNLLAHSPTAERVMNVWFGPSKTTTHARWYLISTSPAEQLRSPKRSITALELPAHLEMVEAAAGALRRYYERVAEIQKPRP